MSQIRKLLESLDEINEFVPAHINHATKTLVVKSHNTSGRIVGKAGKTGGYSLRHPICAAKQMISYTAYAKLSPAEQKRYLTRHPCGFKDPRYESAMQGLKIFNETIAPIPKITAKSATGTTKPLGASAPAKTTTPGGTKATQNPAGKDSDAIIRNMGGNTANDPASQYADMVTKAMVDPTMAAQLKSIASKTRNMPAVNVNEELLAELSIKSSKAGATDDTKFNEWNIRYQTKPSAGKTTYKGMAVYSKSAKTPVISAVGSSAADVLRQLQNKIKENKGLMNNGKFVLQ